MRFIITGSIAFDYLMTFPGHFSEHFLPDQLDKISVSFLVDSLKKQKGGCASNIAYSLALLEETPILTGCVGQDFGEFKAHLEEAGVDMSGVVEYDSEYTASFFGNSDKSGSQIASFCPGAMKYSDQIRIQDICPQENVWVIISPNAPTAMDKYVKTCHEKDIPYIFDPGQQIVTLDKDQLEAGVTGAQITILNDYEWSLFTKATGMDAETVLKRCPTLIITRGEEGSDIVTSDGTIQIPIAKPDRVLDPTGVGDAFRAGLMKGIRCGFSWETSGRLGSLAASYVLETDGPQNHKYSLNSFIHRYIQTFGENTEISSLRT